MQFHFPNAHSKGRYSEERALTFQMKTKPKTKTKTKEKNDHPE